ncbi:MAG TPA: polysaccharide deacetylase family protein [Dehalococcoidia bacterium]|nr:polysaccharide deacetylase family protein [Dehalococcoidia bacterium]
MNLAQRLGYDAGEKLLIIHADDVGSTHAANLATFELLEAGTITSGSLITPAPWFSEAAAYARDHPGADLGIHLALNSEYPLYRWSGVLGKAACPTIHDSGGYLPRTVEELKEGDPEEVEAELRAQIDRALAAGVDVTHLDTHMGAVLRGKFFAVYIKLAVEYRLPCFVWPQWKELRPDAYAMLEEAGAPVLDKVVFETWNYEGEEAVAFFQRVFRELEPGVTHFLIHPCVDGEDIRAVDPEAGAKRIGDYIPFRGEGFNPLLDELGVRRIGYREIRDAYRAGKLAAAAGFPH